MKTIIVAKAVILNPEGKLLALRRSKTDTRRPLQWDIPGGWVDAGEGFAEATAREIQEETGITIKADKLELVYSKTAIRKPHGNVVWLFFIGRTTDKSITLSYEHVESAWMSVAEALNKFEYPIQQEVFAHLKDNHLLTDLSD